MPGAEADPPDDPPAKATILVVEDEVLVRHAVTEFLRDYGFRVLGAVNGEEAVTVLSADVAVDVVFSDVVMPGKLNGFALARWTAAHRPKIRVLLTSGYAGMEQRAGDLGADVQLLDKPSDFQDLLQRIQRLIGQADTA
jgi:CheY-like chemotaxis protein